MKEKKRNRRMMMEDCSSHHSPEIQEWIRQCEEDIKAGRYMEIKTSEINELLEWLGEEE